MKYIEPLFRPPAEADSLIFQIAYGCPHNSCRFCGMYKTVKYSLRNKAEVEKEIIASSKLYANTQRIFLSDGDVMALPFDILERYLVIINENFPKLARINIYANGSSIAMKSNEQLKRLRQLKLNTLYMGLESGSQEILDSFSKRESVEEMISSVIRSQELGFKCSVMILIGLGGKKYSCEHINATIFALNRMQPKLLSALRYIQIPNLKLPEDYQSVSEYEAVEELRNIIANLELTKTVFRANHSSNPIPLSGRFPNDKQKLLAQLNYDLNSNTLDRIGAGEIPLFL